MEEKQYYIGERNNYFFGKLMTVRDFESEQIYFNSKRRLGNRMLNGVGIVSGLDVVLVDNKTFSLETGMALDFMGREIVISEPYVRRLSVIKGFEENKDKGIIYLCIAYKEQAKETTFSVAGSGASSGVSEEFNRISESYELFLTSKKPKEETLKLENLINQRVEVYNQNGIKLTADVGRYVNPKGKLKITLYFEKESVEAPVQYKFDIVGEFFKSSNGSKSLTCEYKETEISTYKTIKTDYYINCDAISEAFANIKIETKDFRLKIGAEEFRLDEDIMIPISIKKDSIRDLIINDYYSKHFDEIIEDTEEKYIYLAKFHIVANQLTYFIESFEKHPFKQYLFSNELISLLQQIETNSETAFSKEENNYSTDTDESSISRVLDLPPVYSENITTGVERINIGFNAKVGKSYYSYEFVHGLGEGNVAIITAIDNKANYLNDDKGLLVFGEKEIFEEEEISVSAPNVSIAAIANSEKGTIRLGVRLREKTEAQAVDIRWWAFKPNEVPEVEDLIIDENVHVVITPNTIRVKPLSQCRFEATIEGAISQEIRWEMAEENTGTIDNNGLYTAPSKEGVYEVKAYSIKFENKSDSAYVVVSSME